MSQILPILAKMFRKKVSAHLWVAWQLLLCMTCPDLGALAVSAWLSGRGMLRCLYNSYPVRVMWWAAVSISLFLSLPH